MNIPQDVIDLFDEFALQVIGRGHTRYSADAILHRIRWHMTIDEHGDDFKCNNNWTALLARSFMDRFPQHNGFFATRTMK